MVLNVVSVLVLIVVAVLFGWLLTRAWRSEHALVKWPGTVLAGLFTLIFAALSVLSVVGFYRLLWPHDNPVADIQVSASPDEMARAERLANGCTGCHSSQGRLPLDGSKEDFVAGGPPFGVMYAPNLTPGGPLKDWSDGEIMRAIREGIHKDGHALVIMPTAGFKHISDSDARALVAYLRSQPAVARDLPERNLNVLAALLVGAGLFPTSAQPPLAQPVVAPEPGITAEYGNYLVTIAGCTDCHGPDLAGGAPSGFGPPAGSNLTAIVPAWSETDFMTMMRTGVDPTGRKVSEDMPWQEFSAMFVNDELKAMHAYLKGLGGS